MKITYALKLFLGICLFAFTAPDLSGQNSTDTNTENSQAIFEDLLIVPMRLPVLQEVGGSLFLSQEYNPATIQIPSGKTISNIPVKFNIFNNAIMLQKDGQDMKLESFRSVFYDQVQNDGTVKHFEFGSGYPEIDKQTEKTIYQVLSKGPKVHLLKYMSQKVEDAATLGDYSRREIVTTEQFYIYVPGGAIKRIKGGKKDFAEALPDLSVKINEFVAANSLKLKSEGELTMLVEALNKP